MAMSIRDLKTFLDQTKTHVHVSCVKPHQHSARQGCLDGEPLAISVCKLVEELMDDRAAVLEVTNRWREK